MSTDARTVDPFCDKENIDPEKPNPTSTMAVLSKHDNEFDEESAVVDPPTPTTRLWKQQSWSPSELSREEAWMRRRDQFRMRRRKTKSLTDEDLAEFRGCIDLGFSFGYQEEEEDINLRNTLPALDFYYALNRSYKFSSSPSSSTTSTQEQDNRSTPSCDDSPHDQQCDSWRISSPGENPQLVKTRLRHWAQLVACSIRQSSSKK